MYIDKIKTFLKKLSFKNIFLIYILLMNVMPIISRATSRFLTTYFYMAVVAITVLFTIISCKLGDIKIFALFLLPFVAYELVEMLSKHNDNALLAGYQVLLFLLPVFLGYYLVTHMVFSQLYCVVLIIIVSITCVTTIIGCTRYPEAARKLATIADSQDPLMILYDWNNIGGYGFVYSTVLMYPFAILAFKMKKLHISVLIVLSVLLFYMAIHAEYTYALLMLMLSMLLFFIRRDISLKNFLLLMAATVIIVLLFRVAIASILTAIGQLIGNQSMVDKINAAFLGKNAVDNFSDNRDELYMQSFRMFLEHPLFGSLTGGSRFTGGHSFLLDSLALYGLLGGGLLAMMYRGIYVLIIRPLKNKPGFVYLFWAFIQPIILSTINTGMWLNNLCLYAPLFICAIYGNDVYLNIPRPKPKPAIPVKRL